MRTAASNTHIQRQLLDKKLHSLRLLKVMTRPRNGWLKAVRSALGISARGLAARIGVDMSAVLQMEEREVKGAVTLESLNRAAKSMNCRLIYAIVPANEYESLEAILNERALLAARTLARDVTHSMKLESQEVDGGTSREQIQKLADELKNKLDTRLWNK
jgi:predicted DNA-binding mobile mystery protein A